MVFDARPTSNQRDVRASGPATFVARHGKIGCSTSGMDHKRTLAPLFDHLVGAGEQRSRDLKAERLRRFEVDVQLELDWSLDRKFARFSALQNTIDVRRCSYVLIDYIRPICN